MSECRMFSVPSRCCRRCWLQLPPPLTNTCVVRTTDFSWSCRSLLALSWWCVWYSYLGLYMSNRIASIQISYYKLSDRKRFDPRWLTTSMTFPVQMPGPRPHSPCSALLSAKEDSSWSRWVARGIFCPHISLGSSELSLSEGLLLRHVHTMSFNWQISFSSLGLMEYRSMFAYLLSILGPNLSNTY